MSEANATAVVQMPQCGSWEHGVLTWNGRVWINTAPIVMQLTLASTDLKRTTISICYRRISVFADIFCYRRNFISDGFVKAGFNCSCMALAHNVIFDNKLSSLICLSSRCQRKFQVEHYFVEKETQRRKRKRITMGRGLIGDQHKTISNGNGTKTEKRGRKRRRRRSRRIKWMRRRIGTVVGRRKRRK